LTAIKDITCLRFGRLTVVHRAESDAAGRATWLCQCDCGNNKIVPGADLRNGNTSSCGCRGSRTGAVNIKHGHLKHYQKSPEYRAWCSAIARCYRPTSDAFPWYGAVGIGVCKRWRSSFSAFLGDMGLKPGPDFILIRKHKDRDYTPSNCEWSAVPSRQAKVHKSTQQTDRRTVVAINARRSTLDKGARAKPSAHAVAP
jgi:hypothetical protein